MRLNKEGIAEDFPNCIDLLFSSEKFMVSEAAIRLMELVHQTLKVRAVLEQFFFQVNIKFI